MNGSLNRPRPELGRILVVDDIADNSFLLKTILEEEGYQVEVVDNGYKALESIMLVPPALVLLDIMMPGLNGFEVVRRVRQNSQLPFVPILLITGYDQPDSAEGFAVGANGFIRKPINIDLLLSRVRALLQPRSTHQQSRGI